MHNVSPAEQSKQASRRARSRTCATHMMYNASMALSFQVPAMESFDVALQYARLADELGYESINFSHIASRDSFTTAAALAMATERVSLGIAVAPIYHRSPASMAQTAATVDEISDGRFRLGLGVGHRATMGGWHGQEIGKPIVEMREYMAIVRAILAGERPPLGQRWTSTFAFMGFEPRADIAIYQAALSPAMLRLAGEIADGVLLWAVPSDHVRDVVIPEVSAGRARAGKTLEGFEVLPAIPSAVGGDRGRVLNGIRNELHRYFGLPFYRTMFEHAGFAEDIAGYDAAAPDREAQKLAISDAFIEQLCAIGDEDALRRGVARYREAGATNPVLTAIWDSDFDATLRAGAQLTAGEVGATGA
jgi:alkanesulfonate monooxygenase SsuD/methylene tetrahydromethanopterin reductase-like flavin-dependent oxidoreductase (luciferase family)